MVQMMVVGSINSLLSLKKVHDLCQLLNKRLTFSGIVKQFEDFCRNALGLKLERNQNTIRIDEILEQILSQLDYINEKEDE